MHLSNTIDRILDTHHALLHAELPEMDRAFASCAPALRGPWRVLSTLLAEHLMKEERILFPTIKQLEAGGPGMGCGLAGPIRQMQHEHGLIEDLEGNVRAHAHLAGALQPRLIALLDDLVKHAHLEDTALFPAALELEGGSPAHAR